MAFSLVVLDWNADRLLAWLMNQTGQLTPVALDHGSVELPLAFSLAERKPQLGKAGLKLCRKLPQQAFQGVLPWIGSSRRWRFRRHKPDALTILGWILHRVYDKVGKALVVSLVPSYLQQEQCEILEASIKQAGMKPIGAIRRASAYSAGQMTEIGDTLFIDIDSHACGLTALTYDGEGYRPRQVTHINGLFFEAWRESILELVVWRCLRVDRRDPRARPEEDQAMLDQFPSLLDDLYQSRSGRIVVEAAERPLEFQISPGQAETACRSLAVRLAKAAQMHATGSCLLPIETAKLPGLFGTLGEAGLRVSTGTSEAAASAASLWARRVLNGQRSVTGPDGPIPLSVEPKEPNPVTLPFPKKSRRS